MMQLYEESADLYDIAYSRDSTDEVDWLISRMGSVDSVLEPGCGSGRMFSAFAHRHVRVIGVERSSVMAERARARLRILDLPADIVEADIAEFNLDTLTSQPLDGAYCTVNTLSYLRTPGQALSHLRAVARHLRRGARYLIQLDIFDLSPGRKPSPPMTWESTFGNQRARTTWSGRSYEPKTRLEVQTSRIEVLDGPGAGDATEDDHTMLLWDWQSWTRLILESPFDLAGVYDESRARLDPPIREAAPLWHELVLPDRSCL
jgi:SAM-dependent methyltransferase